ncbi:HAD-IC family P-type ATPase [Herbiconiux sp. YIM B11900]|uniref:HAD-IC family P-type ATPase n=1 Tax=Herbiconiux sp. YIM B11900 TaxID=3404131 RepID=UPI003F82BA17
MDSELHTGRAPHEHTERGDHDHGVHTAAGHDHSGHAGHDHAGHGDHAGQFRRLFWVMLVLGLPVVGFSSMFAMILGYPLPADGWTTWISPVLGTIMFLLGGRPFLSGAAGELRARRPGMMLLIALAITVAFLASWGATLGILDHQLDFWWELALLIVIMLLGHWIEMRSLAQTTSALDSLAALLPDEAERIDVTAPDATSPAITSITAVAPSELRIGDLVIVRPGARVPADGEVVEGTADVDESMITGESVPVRRGPDDRVVAGTVATDTALRVRITAVGEDTALAGIRRLVTQAQNSSSRAQRIADVAAGWLFWFALAAAVITAVVWTLVGSPDDAVIRTITVLVIACPHALGLAIPLVVSIATERAAKAGILITDRLALETMRTVDTVLFDKTGTLTRGEPAVIAVLAAGGHDEAEVLALAAAAEADSEHPLARAIVEAAHSRGLAVPVAADFEASTAVGVSATVAGATIRVGGPRLLEQRGIAADAAARASNPGTASAPEVGRGLAGVNGVTGDPGSLSAGGISAAAGAGGISGAAGAGGVSVAGTASGTAGPATPAVSASRTVLHVLRDDAVIGRIELADALRPESRAAVDALRSRGVEVVMITGDAEPVARAVAAELGIERFSAGVKPGDKSDKVAELQGEGRTVAMVGDGVNDAPALARADVGIAIGAGTDVAIASAGVVLAGSDPRAVASVIELSRASYRKMAQNLWWAAGYNLLSVPLAAGVLAPVGFILPMAVGAVLMSLSTIIVAANAQLLRRLDLRPRA